MKALPGLLIAAAFATLTFAVWAYLNRPTAEPPWPARIQGFAFSPFRISEDPTRKELPTEDLEDYHDRARDAIGQPVSTAEPWHVWLAHPELAEHVDFIGVHLLPYWEGVPVDAAVEYSFRQFRRLQAAFPGKPIVIAEIGWPSRGRTRESE